MNARVSFRTILVLLVVGTLAACATQPNMGSYSSPGFFIGLFHGLVSPIALIMGFFSEIRVYAFPNSGWWYDLGFMLGLVPWAGGGATAVSNAS